MKDWLDSDECSKLFDDLLHSAVNYEDSRDYYLKLIEKIREHFIEKGPGLFDSIISGCTDHIAAKTYEIDIEKLEKLCGVKNENHN